MPKRYRGYLDCYGETEVMGIYEVYIDVYFIENMILDVQVLALVLLLLKERIVLWRLVMAAVTGGAGAVAVLLSGTGYGLVYIIMVFVLDFFMLCVAIPRQKGWEAYMRKSIMGIIYFHGMAFAHGKLTECAVRLGMGKTARLVVSVTVAVIVLFMVVYHKVKEEKRVYDVVLVHNGNNMELKALFDTGNLLTEPISGKPVSVLEETAALKEWLAQSPQKYKVIPYQSIGNEHGVLEGMYVDELIIQINDEQLIKKDAIIALYKGRLSKDGSFQMILNHSLL